MKIFTNKNLIQKLIIAVVFITLLNFCITPRVEASGFGVLMDYITDFATALGDMVISTVQLGLTGKWTYAVDEEGTGSPDSSDSYWVDDDDFKYPIIQISPELIFANKIQILDANFIGDVGNDYTIEVEDETALEKLRTIISTWYVTLRTIAVVGLLSVLLYVGIRIIISSTSQDRAKYKQRLVDWIVAFCLLFFMHYIMAATVNVIGKVNDLLGDSVTNGGISLANSEHGNVQYKPKGNASSSYNSPLGTSYSSDCKVAIAEWMEDHGYELVDKDPDPSKNDEIIDTAVSGAIVITTHAWQWDFETTDGWTFQLCKISVVGLTTSTSWSITGGSDFPSDELAELKNLIKDPSSVQRIATTATATGGSSSSSNDGIVTVSAGRGYDVKVSEKSIDDGSTVLYYINYVRLFLNNSTGDDYIAESVGYLIIYIVLVTFTVMFTLRYMKRVIYIAFLTLIAPLVALTYPLDKIKDRKGTSVFYVV